MKCNKTMRTQNQNQSKHPIGDVGISDFWSETNKNQIKEWGIDNLLSRTVKTKKIRVLRQRVICHCYWFYSVFSNTSNSRWKLVFFTISSLLLIYDWNENLVIKIVLNSGFWIRMKQRFGWIWIGKKDFGEFGYEGIDVG